CQRGNGRCIDRAGADGADANDRWRRGEDMTEGFDLLEQRLTALTNLQDDSDWSAVRRQRRRPAVLALAAAAVVVTAILGVGAAFGIYGDVLPFGSQEPAPAPVVKDFRTLFGGEGAPPGM